jgi:type II secretory pathway pseudopilin PulG
MKHGKMEKGYRDGMTMVELLVVMGILIILATAVRFFPIGFFYTQSINDDAMKIAFTLRGARDRSVVQKDASAWGVHFVNATGGVDYYQVFKGDTYGTGTVVERVELNGTVQFLTPPSASSTDVMFSKIYGLPSGAGSLILSLISRPATTKTVTVLANGQIQY